MTDTPFMFRATASDDAKSVGLSAFDAELFWGQTSRDELTEHAAYMKVSWVRRCVELRANALSTIPCRITRQGSEDEVEWEFLGALPAMLWMAEASLQIYGASYWERERNRYLYEKGYRWLSPVTMEVKADPSKGLTGFRRNLPQRGPIDLAIDDVVYIWTPALNAEVGPGKGWVTTALTAAGLAQYADGFASDFFKRGAIPALVLSVDGSPSQAELDRLQTWWKRLLAGVKGAWETVAVKASVKPQVIGYPTNQLAMSELVLLARQQIATASGVPQTMLEDAANFATAAEHHQAFYEETIVPDAILIRDALNAQIFRPQGLELALDWHELGIFQEDEEARSASLLRMVQAEVPLALAMEMLGFDLPNGMTYPQFAAELEADRVRKFEEQQQIVRERATALRPLAGPLRPLAGQAGEQGNGPPPAPRLETRAVRDELDRWRRKSLSALKTGESADVAFDTDLLDEDEQRALHVALATATDAEEVRAAFERPFRGDEHDHEGGAPYP